MASRVLEIKMNGFKGIDKPIEFQFAEKVLKDDLFSRPAVKAVYGTNGVGKSSFILGLDVYKNFCSQEDYIRVKNWEGFFDKTINNSLKKAFVSIVIASEHEGKRLVTRHEVEWELHEHNLSVAAERFYKLDSTNWYSGKSVLLIESNGQDLTFIQDAYRSVEKDIREETKNKLDHFSFLSVVGSLVRDLEKNKNQPFFFAHLASVLFMQVVMHESDNRYLPVESLIGMVEKLTHLKPGELENIRSSGGLPLPDKDDRVYRKYVDGYKENIRRTEKFIRVFKPNLEQIKVTPSNDRDFIIFQKSFVYQNMRPVDIRYESTAIKKLVSLYGALRIAANGGIVFIDEFDSDIHDVYFCALIDYFSRASKGQLCYTTHNVSAMEVLCRMPHSLDFMENGVITSWKKNGNYSPVSLYRHGMIPNSPFNVSASDFMGVFR